MESKATQSLTIRERLEQLNKELIDLKEILNQIKDNTDNINGDLADIDEVVPISGEYKTTNTISYNLTNVRDSIEDCRNKAKAILKQVSVI
jgi:archaellum component FlaC